MPPIEVTAPSDSRIDLRDRIGSWPVRDQYETKMCVAFAVCAGIELQRALSRKLAVPEQLSAGYLYWGARRHPPPNGVEGWDGGGIRFDCVVPALEQEGICSVDDCDDFRGQPCSVVESQKLRLTGLRDPVSQEPGTPATGTDANTVIRQLPNIVVAELEASRPVCMGFPVYATANGSDNWNDAGNRDGTVTFLTRGGPQGRTGGHAVCIIGYEPDTAARGGGWLLFRNSLGPDFGERRAVPGVTGNGYGRVSCQDSLDHCWDYLTFHRSDADAALDGRDSFDRGAAPDQQPQAPDSSCSPPT